MVSRTRFRNALTIVAAYALAALMIGYFGMQAFSGNHGLKATEDLAVQLGELSGELAGLKAQRLDWQRRVALLRSDGLDPDMLDERARAMLEYVHPRDLMLLGPRPVPAPAAVAAAQ